MSYLSIITPKIRAYGFRAANHVREFCGFKPAKDFVVQLKQENVPIAQLTDEFVAPKDAKTFKYVKIGKNSDTEYSQEIISFYDQFDEPVQKIVRENGVNVRKQDFVYGDAARKIITYLPENAQETINRWGKDFFNAVGTWKTKSEEIQYVMSPTVTLKDGTRRKIKYVETKKTNIEDVDGVETRRIVVTKYPSTVIGLPKDKKVLEATLVRNGETFDLTDVKKTGDFKFTLDDKFLKYRLLDVRTPEGVNAYIHDLLKERGLDQLGIDIYSVSKPMSEVRHSGCFRPGSGAIEIVNSMQRFPDDVVDTFAHEVEHAYQHAQIGRLGRGNTAYEARARQVLGDINPFNKDELSEAMKYADAKDVYPKIHNGMEDPLYRDNYLEVKARETGEKALQEYRADEGNYFFFSHMWI